jgi:hypothetical protein
VVFTFSGFLTSYPDQQLPVLESSIWLPLELYCIERAALTLRLKQKHSWRNGSLWLAMAGVSVGLAVLAGHPQTILYEAYLGAAYALLRIPWREYLTCLWAVLAAAGVSAVQLLPSLQLFSFNSKGRLDFGYAAGGLVPGDLAGFLFNNPPGGRILYVGLLPLALALFAIIAVRSRQVAFWTAVGIVSVIVGLGTHGPLFRPFFNYLPGWDLFRDQERSVIMCCVALAVLSALGLNELLRILEQDRTGQRTWLAGAAGLAIVVISFLNLYLANNENNLWQGDSEQDFRLGSLLPVMQSDTDLFRVRVSEESISHNSGNLLGLQVVSGNSPFELNSFKAWTEDQPDGNRVTEWQLMQLTATHYIVSSRELCGDRCQEADGIKQLGVDGKLHLFKILFPLPRAFLVTNALGVGSEREAIQGINKPDFDGQKIIYIQGPVSHSTAFDPNAALRADVVGYAPGIVDIRTSSDRPAYLFTSEVSYPGWEAMLDGVQVPILTADGLFRAVDVPAGEHHLYFQYRPIPLYAGMISTGAAVLIMAGALLWAALRR